MGFDRTWTKQAINKTDGKRVAVAFLDSWVWCGQWGSAIIHCTLTRVCNFDFEWSKLCCFSLKKYLIFYCAICRYYRGTHGVIVVYDVTNGESFANVKRWIHEIEHNCEVVNRILVGNKNDTPERKVVLTEDAQRFADQMGLQLFETSAKDNTNVEEVLIYVHYV